jgi:ProP effector
MSGTDLDSTERPHAITAGHLDQHAIEAVIEALAGLFPKCIFVYERHRRPLKVGIHRDIMAAIGGAITPRELSAALSFYVTNAAYCKHLYAGAVRIDLDGEPAGEVTPGQALPVRHKAKAVETTPAIPTPVKPPEQPQGPRRLGLADLRVAAAKRRATRGAS